MAQRNARSRERGGNEDAAPLMGLRVDRIKFFLYLASGTLSEPRAKAESSKIKADRVQYTVAEPRLKPALGNLFIEH